MNNFRFTLEPVAILRQSRERAALGKYAEALTARARAMEELEAVERELALGQHEYRTSLLAGTTTAKVVQQGLYCVGVQKQREQATAAVAKATAAAERALQMMLHTRREREGVDKLRQKQRAGYDREVLREEQKGIDELAGRQRDTGLNWRNYRHD